MQTAVWWAFERTAWPGPGDPATSGSPWLSAEEEAFARGLHSDKRRSDWFRGRRLAKRLCREVFPDHADSPLSSIEIRTLPSGAPQVLFSDGSSLAEGTLSLSHRRDAVSCAIFQADGVSIGIDIEWIETRSDALVRSFFTVREQALVGGAQSESERMVLANTIWSAKEAILKSLGVGLSEDTRALSCLPAPLAHMGDGWTPVDVTVERPLKYFPFLDTAVRWRQEEGYVVTVAVTGRPEGSHGRRVDSLESDRDYGRRLGLYPKIERCLLAG